MNSANELIDWYWSEVDTLRSSKKRYVLFDDGPCHCGTEKIIDDSSNPDRMRSFMMIGVSIDQEMWCHFNEIYPSFRNVFRYPKLYGSGGDRMRYANWLGHHFYQYVKIIDWTVVSDVAQILFKDLYAWFNEEGKANELLDFQEQLKRDINNKFDLQNKEQLIPIIERIEQEQI